jgi:hypothetical protein
MTQLFAKSLKRAALTVAVVCITGCFSVTVRPAGGFEVSKPPTFEQRQSFWFWGLVGERHINVKEVCKTEPVQFQSQQTFVDGLLGFITLGIYAPETARVWCK